MAETTEPLTLREIVERAARTRAAVAEWEGSADDPTYLEMRRKFLAADDALVAAKDALVAASLRSTSRDSEVREAIEREFPAIFDEWAAQGPVTGKLTGQDLLSAALAILDRPSEGPQADRPEAGPTEAAPASEHDVRHPFPASCIHPAHDGSGAPGLDLERLVNAIHARRNMLDGCRHPNDDIAECDNEADWLYAEYARLAEPR